MNLRDIAQLAGVSRSTVSRVVNHDRRVSPAVRERVERIIADVGYQPNSAARALASNRAKSIGLVLPHARDRVYSDPWFPRFVHGATDVFRQLDVDVVLALESTTDPESVAIILQKYVVSRSVDGLIIGQSFEDDVLVEELARRRFPYVLVGHDVGFERNFVDARNREGMCAVAKHALSQGAQRVLFLSGPPKHIASMDRWKGVRDAIDVLDRPDIEIACVDADFDQSRAFRITTEALASDHPPDTVICASDAMAFGAIDAARELGLRIPQDITVSGFDGYEPDRIAYHRLTTARHLPSELGSMAARLVLSLIDGRVEEPVQQWMDVDFLPNRSTDKLNGSHERKGELHLRDPASVGSSPPEAT